MYHTLTLLHSEGPKLYGVLAILSAIGLKKKTFNVPGNHLKYCILVLTVLSTLVEVDRPEFLSCG